jgi:hypothetical protein
MPQGISTSQLATMLVSMTLLFGIFGLTGLVWLWRYGKDGAGVAAFCGVFLLILGYYLYAWSSPQRQVANSWLGQLGAFFSSDVARAVELVNQAYSLSLGLIAWGLFLLLAAFWLHVPKG